LRIPEPEGDEPILQRPSAQPSPKLPPPAVPAPAAAKARHGLGCPCCSPIAALRGQAEGGGSGFPDQDALDAALLALSDEQLQTQMEVALQPVLRLAQTNPEQMMTRLADLYPEMNTDQLTETLARVMFVAETWGRLTAGATDA
jgi:phage gp29-like protein